MEFSNELIKVLKRDFPLRYKPSFYRKPKFVGQSSDKNSDKNYTINRFPIACVLGYKWAKKQCPDFSDNLCQAIGYGISLMPNCVKRGWAMGWGKSGHPCRVERKLGLTNEERVIQNAEDLKKFKIVSFSRWNFIVDFENNRICGADMRTLEWWDVKNYQRAVIDKMSKNQLINLYSWIDKEFSNMSAEQIGYSYSKQYKSFWQQTMDRLRTKL